MSLKYCCRKICTIQLQKLVILKDTYEKEDHVAMKLLHYGRTKRKGVEKLHVSIQNHSLNIQCNCC